MGGRKWATYEVASRRVLIFESLVSAGTLGMQSRSSAKALLMDMVRRRSFLLAVLRRFTTRTRGPTLPTAPVPHQKQTAIFSFNIGPQQIFLFFRHL